MTDVDTIDDYEAIELVPVTSSNVAAVGWNAATRQLFVRFIDKRDPTRFGALYAYEDVPIAVYHGLLNASSVGGFFHENVKKVGYTYRRIS